MTIAQILEEIKKLPIHDRIKLVDQAIHLIDEDLHRSVKKEIHPFRIIDEDSDLMESVISYSVDKCSLK